MKEFSIEIDGNIVSMGTLRSAEKYISSFLFISELCILVRILLRLGNQLYLVMIQKLQEWKKTRFYLTFYSFPQHLLFPSFLLDPLLW